MRRYTRTDLACENMKELQEEGAGIEEKERRVGDFVIRTVRVLDEYAAERIGMPCGTYLSLECGRLAMLEEDAETLLVHLLAGELRGIAERLCGKRPDSGLNVFVAGLGNAEFTVDAVGPKTVSRLTVTRHLREHEEALYRAIGCCALSALAPGVLGQTGIETLEILRGAARVVHPDVMIAVDALAARSCDRLATTIQISDVGIVPGSGVGNHRGAITEATMGVPVIAIGIPTVVDSSTLVYDALQKAGIESIDDTLRNVLENGRGFLVSPKDSDQITNRTADVLSRAIGEAFAKALYEKQSYFS